jgi:hypothetical protein
MAYFIHKQLIPKNNLIWVLKINDTDEVYSFESLEDANSKKEELIQNDINGRVYKVSLKKEDGSFSDM